MFSRVYNIGELNNTKLRAGVVTASENKCESDSGGNWKESREKRT